ncbi:MAG: polysaccharide pyruvyl transferase family protein [Anaerolineae bacterium]|nr:polysaccharide pyruvyl transferase family protein [Anaerolineae bacterium]
MQHIGLLWDSVSNNMGDMAIGLVLQRAFARSNIPFRVIDPYLPALDSIASLVIGGGELIRTVGDPFYDIFRAPGRHILNTVGVLDGADNGFLDGYRLITVRSQADRARLGRGEVAPCVTLLYNDYVLDEDALPDIPPGAIGINLNYSFYEQIEPLVAWLRQSGLGPIVWLPITHYNADALLMQEVAAHVPHSLVLPPLSPDATFRAIGSLSALVSFSLHASIFAYAQGIPMLGYRPVGKLTAFMEERDQGASLFETADDIARLLPLLLEAPPDLMQRRQQDEQTCRQWLAQMLAEAENALSSPSLETSIRLRPANARYHGLEMSFHWELGTRTVLIVRGSLQTAALRASLTNTRATLATASDELFEARSTLENARGAAAKVDEELLDTRASLANTRATLTTVSDDLAGARDKLINVNEAYADLRVSLANTRATLTTVSDELADARLTLAETRVASAEATSVLEDTQASLANARATLTTVSDDLAGARLNLADKGAALALATAELAETRATITDTEAALAAVTANLGTVQSHLDSLRSTLVVRLAKKYLWPLTLSARVRNLRARFSRGKAEET